MQKKNRARTKKTEKNERDKKDTVLQRLRRSSYRCAGAQTSRNKRVLETRRKSSSTDLLRLEGKKKLCFSLKVEFAFVQKKKEKKEQGESTKTKRISQKKDFEDLPKDRALKFLLEQVMLCVTLFHRKICDPLDSHDQVSLIDYASLGYSISTYSMWEGLVEGLARQPKTKGEIKRTNRTEL